MHQLMQFKIHVSTEQKQTKNKRFMALSSNNKIAKKKTIGLGLFAFMVTFLTNFVSLSIQCPSPDFGVHVAL